MCECQWKIFKCSIFVHYRLLVTIMSIEFDKQGCKVKGSDVINTIIFCQKWGYLDKMLQTSVTLNSLQM